MTGPHVLRRAFILVFVCLLLTGCGPEWKKKFIRKRKNVTPPQPILVLESDEKALLPPRARYQEHYAYWKSWHSELLKTYGQSRKRDLRYLSGAISELRAMREILSGGLAAARLDGMLVELTELEEFWKLAPESWHPSSRDRVRLEKFQRILEKDFAYSDLKESIPAEN